ncbi:hypothetical protein VPH35_129442 [Triticum aestivum]
MATEPGAGAFTRCAYGSGGDDGAYGSGGDDGAYGSGGGQDVPSAISTSKSRIGGARTMALQGIEPEECDPSCQDRFLRVGLTKHHQEIAECFNQRGVSLIFLLRRKKTSAAKYQETKWNS